ncbi:MAG TPA: hypothetical protein VGL38_05030 [bacterium]|jgi:hypothetical protein
MKRFAAIALLTAVTGMAWWGCNDKYPPMPRTDGPIFPRIVMLTPTDTLQAFPGDSAAVQGYVKMTNGGTGLPQSDFRVHLSLVQPGVGFIEYTSATQDTTDADGRVDFVFHTRCAVGAGYNIIHANYGSVECNYTMWFRAATTMDVFDTVHVELQPDTVHVRGAGRADSVNVRAWTGWRSGMSAPAGFNVSMTPEQGVLDMWQPTDDNGTAIGLWFPPATPSRYYFISGCRGGRSDTAWVTVLQ